MRGTTLKFLRWVATVRGKTVNRMWTAAPLGPIKREWNAMSHKEREAFKREFEAKRPPKS